jgi:hypothetical protein
MPITKPAHKSKSPKPLMNANHGNQTQKPNIKPITPVWFHQKSLQMILSQQRIGLHAKGPSSKSSGFEYATMRWAVD